MQQHKEIGCNASLPIYAGFESKGWIALPRILVNLAILALKGSTQKLVEQQTQVNQTVVACSLERYRTAHGSYPPSLDAIVPNYLVKVPYSPITGMPMNYSAHSDGTFLLWSAGWNMSSLGGKTGEFKGDGDIVWN